MSVAVTFVRRFTRYFWEIVIVTVLLVVFLVIVFSNPTAQFAWAETAGRPAPGGTYENLVYFLQVSDVHLSKFDASRGEHFSIFCNETVPVVNPALVIHTGDITDAVKFPAGSTYYQNEQFLEEWEFYKNTLVEHGYFNKSFWLDLRGNHDAFAIPHYSSPNNYFKEYAVYGDVRDYTFVLNTGFASYQFVTMDLTFDLGLSSPFDFFGLPPDNLTEVLTAVNNAANFNHTILLGHYPRVTTIDRVPWGRLTKGKVLAYLCGHIHAKTMWNRMPGDYLELELAVWTSQKKKEEKKSFPNSFLFFLLFAKMLSSLL